MRVGRRWYRMTLQIAVMGVCAGLPGVGRSAAPGRANAAAQQAAGNDAGQAEPCAAISDTDIPLTTTIRAKVTNLMDAAHLKPRQEDLAEFGL